MSTDAPEPERLLRDCEPRTADVGGRLAVHHRLFPRRVQRLDRFEIRRRIGRGGMGQVFEALDPRLERSVALKVLRPDNRRSDSELLLEARAMARLRHPHVVPVYDVHQCEGQVFIVMEYVEGRDLGVWLGETPQRTEDIVRVFIDAGRGLCAAHRAGLVHRDFKPSNVLLDTQGRVLVTDFGLAISCTEGPETKGFAGTLRYAAPEVIRGEGATTAADQFSFCTALLEALEGARGAVGWRMRRIRAALRRGSARQPEQRWPSMDALLTELAPRRWRFVAAASLLGALGGSTIVSGAMAPAADPCAELAGQVEHQWSPERRTRLADVLASRLGADPRIERGLATMDELSDAWRVEAASTCMAGRAEPGSPAHTCLAAMREELSVAAEYLETEAPDGARVLDALPSLRDIRSCSEWDDHQEADDPWAVAAVEQTLARIRGRLRVGAPGALLPDVERLVAQAQSMDHAPLLAHALRVHGDALQQSGSLQSAVVTWQRAFDEALAGGDQDTAFQLARDLALGYADTHLRQPAEARRWAGHARALGRAQPRSPASSALVEMAEGTALSFEHEHERAIAVLEGALARLADSSDAMPSSEHVRMMAIGHQRLAVALHAAGQWSRARDVLEDARTQLGRVLGESHPEQLRLLVSGAAIAGISGELDVAAEELEQAEALIRQLGLDADPRTLEYYVNRAELEVRRGHPDLALEAASAAVSVARRVPGLHPDRVALALVVQGSMLAAAGRIDAAEASAREAETRVTDDERLAAGAAWLLGSLRLRADDANGALEAFRRAAEAEARGDVHAPNRATVDLALLELRAGQVEAARAQLRRARSLLDTVPDPIRVGHEDYLERMEGLIDAVSHEHPARERAFRTQLEALAGDDADVWEVLAPPRSSPRWSLGGPEPRPQGGVEAR